MRSAANRDRRERRAQEHAERRDGWQARGHARWDANREARRDAAWNAGGHLSGYPDDARSRRSLRRERHEEYHRLGGPSFAKRLLGAFIVAWLLSMVLAGGLLQTMSSWHPAVAVAHWLDGQSTFIDKHLRFDAAGRPVALVESDDTAWAHGAAPRDWKYRVVDERGVVLLGSDPGAPPLAPAGRAFDRADGSFDIVQDGVLLHVATKAFAHGGHAPYFIQTAVSERSAALFRGSLVRAHPAERGRHRGDRARCCSIAIVPLRCCGACCGRCARRRRRRRASIRATSRCACRPSRCRARCVR